MARRWHRQLFARDRPRGDGVGRRQHAHDAHGRVELDRSQGGAAEAKNHVGEFKTVVGTVVSGKYLSRSKGKPTFINLDKPYPNQIFTILIWGSDRSKFKQPPESLYYGKKIAVTGVIIEYKGITEIIVRNPSQIELKE